VLVTLLIFGGESVRWFVVALLIGIVSGTYSSIFNAAPLLVTWQEWDKRRKSSKK
jgi:preprotein translocase subunit SecF